MNTYICVYIYIYIHIYINRISCGKVPHVALVRCNSFDESVCDCYESQDLYVKNFKMDQNEYPKQPTWSQKGAKTIHKVDWRAVLAKKYIS